MTRAGREPDAAALATKDAPPAASLVDDARGVARLVVDGVIGVTDIVEHLHATIGDVPAPVGQWTPAPARGVAGFVYRRVRDLARGVGWTVDSALRRFEGGIRIEREEREHVLAALNGVLGHQLAEAGNPLAIAMRLAGDRRAPTGRIAVFVHGLCMHDRQWPRGDRSMHALAIERGRTPVYLRYNSGLSIAANGAEFSRQLDELLASWPRRVTEITIVGHSMGGLVARAATVHARRDAARWLRALRTLVFLGTPHRGSSLERAGTNIDFALRMSPYSAPFARLGGARSHGIRGLGDDLSAMALPEGVHCVAVAGRLVRDTDGLVSVASALGLPAQVGERIVIEGAGHLELLGHPEAVATLEKVLVPRRRRSASPGDGVG